MAGTPRLNPAPASRDPAGFPPPASGGTPRPLGYDLRVSSISAGTASARNWRDLVGLLARLVLGGALLVAGLLKVTHPAELVLSIRAYQLVPYEFAKLLGNTLPMIEIVVGLLIIVGLFTRVTAALGALMMLVFIVAISSAWARGLSLDCGCFGGGGTVDPDQTHYVRELLRDTGFLAAGIWLIVRPRSVLAIDNWLFRPLPGAPTHGSHAADAELDAVDATS